jgi:hypothetical protein
MKLAHETERGAVGLEGEMIDAPMLKQVGQRSFILAKLSHIYASSHCLAGGKNDCNCQGGWLEYT